MGFAIQGAEERAAGKNAGLGVTAPDDRTVVIKLNYRTPYFLYVIATSPFLAVPQHIVEKFGGATQANTAWTKPGNLVGANGPFVLSAWHSNQDIIMTRNPYYWDRARVQLTSIRFMPTDDTNAEERSFRTGAVHVTYACACNTETGGLSFRARVSAACQSAVLSTELSEFQHDSSRRSAMSASAARSPWRSIANALFRTCCTRRPRRHAALTRPGTERRYTPPNADAQSGRSPPWTPAGRGRLSGRRRASRCDAFDQLEPSHGFARSPAGSLAEGTPAFPSTLHAEELKTFIDSLHSQNYQVAHHGATPTASMRRR